MGKYLETIIGGSIGLVGVVIGFLLQLLSASITEKKRVKEDFDKIKNAIHSTALTNNLFPALLEMKKFFVRNSRYLNREANNSFLKSG